MREGEEILLVRSTLCKLANAFRLFMFRKTVNYEIQQTLYITRWSQSIPIIKWMF